MIQRHVYVSGRVQGVGFRASTLREAKRHDALKGYVRNLPDGRVEAVFAGSEAQVLSMVAWCKVGPPSAQVDSLDVREEDFDASLAGFSVT